MHAQELTTIVRRSETGPFMREDDFDLALAMRVRELVENYSVVYDPEVLVPDDDGLADRLYEAALDLFVEFGTYNQSTERQILFTKGEVERAVAASPSRVVLGTGKDATIESHRAVEDSSPCRMHSGPTGTPISEDLHSLILQSCAQEPMVDCLGHGSVATFHDQPIIPGSPLEIMAAKRDAFEAREAVRSVGRPGMHIEDIAMPLTCAGKMAAFDPENGLRPSDGLLVSQLPELKTNYDQLSRVAFMRSVDMHIVDLMTPLIGGLGGGAEGTAIVTIASHILGVVLYSSSYHFMGHMSLQGSHNTGREGLWIQAVAGQALARNTPLVSANDLYTRSGLGTDEIFWEIAAGAMIGAVCGLHQHGVGATGGFEKDQTSGLEARFQAEVAQAALGMSRSDVNQLVKECLVHYETSLQDPNPGSPFQELYNLDTLEPMEVWVKPYHDAREKLETYGLEFGPTF